MSTRLNRLGRILPSGRAFILYVAGFSALALTAMMNRHAGISQAATEQGRDLLGYSSIVIDIVGLVVFGSIAGNLLAAGKRGMGILVLLITLLSGVYSIGSIMTFVATEWLSVAESRRASIQAHKDKEDQARAQAEMRLKLQGQAAETAPRSMQATVKDAQGRKERTLLSKNFTDGATRVIETLGKDQTQSAVPAPTSEEKIQLRPDAGAEAMSLITTLPEKTYQITRIALLACLLIAFKMVAFPLGGYYYSQRRPLLPAPPTFHALAETPPEALIPVEPPKISIEPPKPPSPPPIRAELAKLSPEWRALLEALDFPPKKLLGALREKVPRAHLGWRWYAWLCAFERGGTYESDALTRSYEDHCAYDHREQWGINAAKGELRGAARKLITTRDAKSPTTDTITLLSLDKLKDRLIKAKALDPAHPALRGTQPALSGGAVVLFPATKRVV